MRITILNYQDIQDNFNDHIKQDYIQLPYFGEHSIMLQNSWYPLFTSKRSDQTYDYNMHCKYTKKTIHLMKKINRINDIFTTNYDVISKWDI